jgi:catalase
VLGTVGSVTGDPLEADVSVEAMPSVLYDAVVIPDGEEAIEQLAADGRVLEFVKDQYRHCKPLLVLGAGASLLEKAGIPPTLASGKPDPGLILSGSSDPAVADTFIKALAKHRHYERESDPPPV